METTLLLSHCIRAVELLKAHRTEIEKKGEALQGRGDTLVADKRAEDLLIAYFQELGIPGKIISEELSKNGEVVSLGNEYLIAIDPYDGTMNFKRRTRLPYGALVTIFASEQPTYGEVLAASVISLTDNDLWYAEKGRGCFYRGSLSHGLEMRCSVSQQTSLNRESFLFIDFFNASSGLLRAKLPDCYARNIGSAAIELALMATGNADARISTCQKAHELGAGNFLIEEAGGFGVTLDGRSIRTLPYDFNEVVPCIHAGTEKMAYEILEKIKA